MSTWNLHGKRGGLNGDRKHLTAAPVAPAGTPPVGTVWVGSSPTLPRAGEPPTRDLSLEVSDTAEGRIGFVHYGRFRVACPITHGDIVRANWR